MASYEAMHGELEPKIWRMASRAFELAEDDAAGLPVRINRREGDLVKILKSEQEKLQADRLRPKDGDV